MKSKAVLVTGASSGIGRACALELARAGHRVLGVSRSGTLGDSPVEGWPPDLVCRVLDITDARAVERTMGEVVAELGRLDGVVNAAGIAVGGPLEDTPIELARAQLETSLLGAIYVTRAALKYLRRFAPSKLIHLSSLAGEVALPYQSLYCAAKYGLEGLCESLRYEMEPHGVHVVSIRPGSVRTALTRNRRTVPAGEGYREPAARALRANDADEEAGVDPFAVALAVAEVLEMEKPPAHWAVGHWSERISVPVKRFLPESCFRRFIASHYRL